MTNPLISARDEFSARHPEQSININGRTWGVLQVGKVGPALVLIPGTLGRADIFWQQIDALKNKARILAVSYPDTGSIEEWAADICDLMDRNDMDKATVLGSSLGGYLAQYMAGQHPERLNNLIAANTLHSVAILKDIPPYNTDMDAAPITALRQGFTDGMEKSLHEEPQFSDLIELLMQEVGGRIPERELRMRLNALKHGPELPKPDLPLSNIYTIESDNDRLIPPPVRDAVRERLAPVRSYKFPLGTHFPYVTCANDYTAILKSVLGITE